MADAELEAMADAVIVTMKSALAPLAERLARSEAQLAQLVELQTRLGTIERDVPTLRERVAVLETRAPVPGPPGTDGKDGADGLGWDDLTVTQPDERTVTVQCVRGDRMKEVGTLVFPVEIYRGVWVEGKSYARGDGVTWAGSEWHCHEPTTTKPGDGSKAWTLKVKRGRDGKDAKGA
jgi:hypothetical protein